MNDDDNDDDDDDDDDDLSRGLTGGGGGGGGWKAEVYDITHEGVFLWVINDALMALLGACFQKVYIHRVFSQCELFYIA